MNISESEKNRIRGLHKESSVIKESWGSKQDEYGRTDGHRHGDVGGHYKDYEGEYGGNAHEYKRTDGHKDGVVDGHYKTYEMGEQNLGNPEFPLGEDGDVIGVDRPESEKAQDEYDTFGEGDAEFNVEQNDITINEDSEGEETYNYGEDEGEDHDEEMDLEHDEDMAPHDRVDAIQKHLDALKKDMSYDEDREDRGEDGDDFE
jgi:hypothetical protein